jgi:hypothetical protein
MGVVRIQLDGLNKYQSSGATSLLISRSDDHIVYGIYVYTKTVIYSFVRWVYRS